MVTDLCARRFSSEGADPHIFEKIANDIRVKGFSVQPNGLPEELAISLQEHIQDMSVKKFKRAGIGRDQDLMLNKFVRTDEICWINGDADAGRAWLAWAADLQLFLNRNLLLGLFSFESHFAHYRPGDYYKKHLDAFKGEANRVLSMVTYLNPDWQHEDGGELVLYTEDGESLKVLPRYGTVVVFLSEVFPHEVLPAERDRYSIAGWFRINSSTSHLVDPPR